LMLPRIPKKAANAAFLNQAISVLIGLLFAELPSQLL